MATQHRQQPHPADARVRVPKRGRIEQPKAHRNRVHVGLQRGRHR